MQQLKTAQEVALEAIKKNPESYFTEPFVPHPWVIDAMLNYAEQFIDKAAEVVEQIMPEEGLYEVNRKPIIDLKDNLW